MQEQARVQRSQWQKADQKRSGNKEAHKKACEHWNEGGLAKVWIDKDGYLCIEYESGEWWHYNDKGEWW